MHTSLITVAEAARLLRISPAGVYRLIREKGAPHLRVHRAAIRIQPDELLRWIIERSQSRSTPRRVERRPSPAKQSGPRARVHIVKAKR
jgi:excisionase family DNA binding protein